MEQRVQNPKRKYQKLSSLVYLKCAFPMSKPFIKKDQRGSNERMSK